jgi:LPXTG-motif cell wall-anchored protein
LPSTGAQAGILGLVGFGVVSAGLALRYLAARFGRQK